MSDLMIVLGMLGVVVLALVAMESAAGSRK